MKNFYTPKEFVQFAKDILEEEGKKINFTDMDTLKELATKFGFRYDEATNVFVLKQ